MVNIVVLGLIILRRAATATKFAYIHRHQWQLLENISHELMIRRYRSGDFYISNLAVVQGLCSKNYGTFQSTMLVSTTRRLCSLWFQTATSGDLFTHIRQGCFRIAMYVSNLAVVQVLCSMSVIQIVMRKANSLEG